ncbi:MAG: iron-only hydrogenase system regulator [Proteobacteria bacterium]|nr:iron-only hydrogenase system regulator [Pseudomonadota bacterium]MBQ9244031.1 iron-only hydrogenase system regulator [Pseudomonadota bacterium]
MSEDTRVAVLGIIVENMDSVEALNAIVHEYRDIILGRMGIPYRQKKINIVSLAVDAPPEVINALSGKIGRLPGITVKTAYANTRS